MVCCSVAILVYNKKGNSIDLVRQFRPGETASVLHACELSMMCCGVTTAVYMSRNHHLLNTSAVFANALSMKQVPASTAPQDDSPPPPPPSTDQVLPQDAITYELCAGIIDKPCSPEQIAREELLEEMGYDVPLDKLKQVTGYHTSMGTSGSYQTMFYCEVTEEMISGKGGGNPKEGEMIDVVHIPASEVIQFALDTTKCKGSGLCFALFWFDKMIRSQHNKNKLL